MKDLYKRLGLSPVASESDIRARLNRMDVGADLREAAEQILLVPSRRTQHDIVRRSLGTIGILRANLGINRTELWLERDLSDFDVKASTGGSQLEALRAEVQSRPSPVGRDGSSVGWFPRLFAVAVIGGFIWWMIGSNEESSGSNPTPATRLPESPEIIEIAVPEAPFDAPQLPLPTTSILTHVAPKLRNGAPFEIVTSGSGGYYVKIVDAERLENTMTAFVRGGDRLNTILPIGRYELRYAAGAHWYGLEHLFGPKTRFSRADEVFNLVRTPDGYLGVTVELILQQNGNLRTESMDAANF